MTPDWTAPWLAGCHQPLAQDLHAAWRQQGDLPSALNGFPRQAGVRFVPQAALPEGVAYEQFIFDTLQVPTRENLHDFFNGLMWLQFRRAKRRLNLLQAGELARLGGVGTRGPLRDALTLFDENVALFRGPDSLWQALAHKRWQELFGRQRTLWAQCDILLFGHALLEQLVQPFKSITAHVYRVPEALPAMGAPGWQAAWDDWLAQDLGETTLVPKPYVHLPVLGVPGWWPENADPHFYADTSVFRPLRRPPPEKITI